jgi:hypothetical protein
MKAPTQVLGALAVLLVSGVVLAAPAKPATPDQKFLLPKNFAGWEKSSSQPSTDAGAADPVNATILREFGFTDFEAATYKRSDAREMTVRAARFADASGAYGSFMFYKLPQMLTEQFGDEGASLNERAFFYRGNILVDAKLDRVTAMSAAELRELADTLALPEGPARNLPTLPGYLPRQAYVQNSARYIEGPAGLAAVGTPVPPELVDFSRGAEVTAAKYSTSDGTATLLLVSYPTPQIAGERMRAFSSLNQNPQPAADATLAGPFTLKRTGPIVALVAGQISAGEAKSLLASVNYDADVTWNENTHLDQKDNVANLLVNVVFLIAIIFGFSLVVGVAFGGVRLVMKRLYPGRIFDRPEDVELIQLGLGFGDKGR